jgi:hypothetical protein
LLGEGGGGGAAGEPVEGESELDSFFEDLSTIDDLEVLQEDDGPAAEAEAAVAEAVEEESAFEEELPAAPVAQRARPARQAQAKKERGFFGRLLRWLILLALVFGGGYWVYQFFFPDVQPPWQVVEQETDKLVGIIEERLRPPPPELVPAPAPAPAPARPAPPPPPRPAAPPPERGPWSIQVATCFFPSCMESYRSYLESHKRSVIVRERSAQSESLEIYSQSTWSDRQQAQDLADRVNHEHPLEGQAFLFREDGGYRISMGAFADLARANIVKDALNQQYRGEIVFATRAKAFPYRLQSVLTGRYPTRATADQALAKLKDAEPRLKDAFVTRNQ